MLRKCRRFTNSWTKEKYELSGRVRGMYALTDRLLVVAGQKLYSISKSDQIEEIGEVAGVNTVYFADNSIQVMIVSNKAYSFNLRTNTLSTMSGPEFLVHLMSHFWTHDSFGRYLILAGSSGQGYLILTPRHYLMPRLKASQIIWFVR